MLAKKNNRAEIFAPYDSLKGFFQMIKEKEVIEVEERILSEDDLQELDYTFQQIKKGMIVKIVYEQDGKYIQKEGMVSKIDSDYTKTIRIVNTTIHIGKIYEIEITQDS